MKCRNCGAELDEQLVKCPYCNEETGNHPPETRQKNTFGIVGLVFGIIGLVLSCIIVGIVPAGIGLVFSILGLRKKNRKKRMALAGCICSSIAILIALLVFILIPTGNKAGSNQKDSSVQEVQTETIGTEEQKEADKQESEETENKASDVSEAETEGEKSSGDEKTSEQENQTERDYANYPTYSLGYLCYYISEHNMEAYLTDTSKEEEKISEKNTDFVNVKIEKGGFFGGGDYYTKTQEDTGEDTYWYAGDLKDNRPDGFGILYQAVEANISESDGNYLLSVDTYLGGEEMYLSKVYAGYFKEGQFDGTGTRYYTNEDAQETGVSLQGIPVSEKMYQLCQGDIQQLVYLAGNPILYSGEFETGEYSGEGSTFTYAIAQDEATGEVKSAVSATSGEFENGKANGKVKEYIVGYLSYDGEMKDDQFDGEGTVYFYLSDQKQYVGNLKNGKQNGQGTEYDKDGNVVYSGKWSDGDYAD